MTGLLCAVPYGPGAFAVLRDLLGELRGGDPLAPAEVAVPSSFTAVTVRRRLAAPGLVGIRFSARSSGTASPRSTPPRTAGSQRH